VTNPQATAPSKADLAEIRRALALLCEPDRTYELRVLHTRQGTTSGYFTDFAKMATAAAVLSGNCPGEYTTLNPCNPILIARAVNRVKPYARETTQDADILRRRWLPVDFDPRRPGGISSSDAEHQLALDMALRCRGVLAHRGWPDPIFADSGNGAHLLYRIDEPADDKNGVAQSLKALAAEFNDEAVTVDVGNSNPARIWKVYGTLAAKGDCWQDRIHRIARIIEAPE